MSFGHTDALVGDHVAGLRRGRGTTPRRERNGARHRLRNGIGIGLVEIGLHLMARTRDPALSWEPAPWGDGGQVVLRPSSTVRGR